MEEFKGTKGEWHIIYGTPNPKNSNCTSQQICVGGFRLADVWMSDDHPCKSLSENIANAHVMVASRDLLEACKSALSCIEELESRNIVTNFSAKEKIKSAISKALNLPSPGTDN